MVYSYILVQCTYFWPLIFVVDEGLFFFFPHPENRDTDVHVKLVHFILRELTIIRVADDVKMCTDKDPTRITSNDSFAEVYLRRSCSLVKAGAHRKKRCFAPGNVRFVSEESVLCFTFEIGFSTEYRHS